MIAHAESITMNTSTPKDFNRSILMLVEAGTLDWTPSSAQNYDLLKMHFLAGLRSENKPANNGGNSNGGNSGKTPLKERQRRARNVCCRPFGDGDCPESGDHGSSNLHLCYNCMVARELRLPHSRSACHSEEANKQAGRR